MANPQVTIKIHEMDRAGNGTWLGHDSISNWSDAKSRLLKILMKPDAQCSLLHEGSVYHLICLSLYPRFSKSRYEVAISKLRGTYRQKPFTPYTRLNLAVGYSDGPDCWWSALKNNATPLTIVP